MGQKFAAYDSTGAIAGFYDSIDSPAPDGLNTIKITDAQWIECLSNPGYTVSGGTLVAPTPPTAQQQASQSSSASAQAAISAGLSITSANTPALNGTYAVDPLSQMDIIAIETSLNAGKGFPGGATAFGYPDTSGVMHAFTAADFADFAVAVRDYVYALKSVIAGASTTLPQSTTAIA